MPQPAIFFGIDPGLKGAISAISCSQQIIDIIPMPITGNQPSMVALEQFFDRFANVPSVAALEVANAMMQKNKDGSKRDSSPSSMLAYGTGLGILKCILFTKRIPCKSITSSSWMADMGVHGKTSGKYNADKVLVKLLPDSKDYIFENGKLLDGKADATLIALWRKRQYENDALQILKAS